MGIKINLTEDRIGAVIRESINRLLLNEYHDQLRFNWPEYGYGHSFIDEFIDWLQYASKKETLPKPSITFEDGLKKGYEEFSKHYDSEDWSNYREFWGENIEEHYCDFKFDDNGNLYVERSIRVDPPNSDIFTSAPDLYQSLIDKYEKNVGGCWSYERGGAGAKCGYGGYGGVTITFKGYILLDDIYWEEFIAMFAREYAEREIRPIPNGRIMLTGISIYAYGIINKDLGVESFDGPRVIRATYFGDNETFKGLYATLGYDSISQSKAYIDRQGNQYSHEEFENVINERLKVCHTVDDVKKYFGDFVKIEKLTQNLSRVRVNGYCGHVNIANENGVILHPDQWFYSCGDFLHGFAVVTINGKSNFIDLNGELLLKKPVEEWFDDTHGFREGLAPVQVGDKWTFIDKTGEFAFPGKWFDDAFIYFYGYVNIKLNGKWNFIDTNGKLVYGDYSSTENWFDSVDIFRKNGLAEVTRNGKKYFLDKNGNLHDEK